MFSEYGVDWSEYEESLASMDLDTIAEDLIRWPDYLSDKESDRDAVILNVQLNLESLSDAIGESLKEMVSKANEDLWHMMGKTQTIFSAGDVILSFNYTSTIETMYDLPDECEILHIHGYYENGDNLVFGYRDSIL